MPEYNRVNGISPSLIYSTRPKKTRQPVQNTRLPIMADDFLGFCYGVSQICNSNDLLIYFGREHDATEILYLQMPYSIADALLSYNDKLELCTYPTVPSQLN